MPPSAFNLTPVSQLSLRHLAALVITMACLNANHAATDSAAAIQPFRFRDGDRVVLLGDTFIEREQTYGFIEQRLTVEEPLKNVTFRNLGWSADTPDGQSRAVFDFDKPGKGYEKLKAQVAAVKPTVIVLGYGMASSFAGKSGLAKFQADFKRLLDDLAQLDANTPVRFVLITPITHEDLGAPWPNPTAHNQDLALYCKALAEIAAQRNCPLVRLDQLLAPTRARPLTENGIHLSSLGYSRASEAISRGLNWTPNFCEIKLGSRAATSASGTVLSNLEKQPRHYRFTALDDRLPNPNLPTSNEKPVALSTPPCRLQISDLEKGQYRVSIDDLTVFEGSAADLRRGITVQTGPQFNQAEELRKAILEKNTLYFDRWRPQNETYLFGFRKHEQGQNAKEIPMFDPLIEQQERKIAELRKPRAHTFEIVQINEHLSSPIAKIPVKATKPSIPVSVHVAERNSAAQPHAATPEFEVATGFEVNLFAESPLLAKPIQMNFDPSGRLWIASSSVYPQVQPGQTADDKILVLEDTNGDGYAEKSTVFADGLLIPTGIEPGDGGVYVGQSTELIYFKDTNNDGRADQRRTVLSGFGTEDTHHMVHTLHWGPDGRLYFNQSIYIHTHIETPHGVRHLNSGGVWRMRTSNLELGVLLRGFCNPWGHQIDEFGQSFLTDGAGFQGLNFGVPGATYFTYADMRRELKSISPGSYPKFCGLEIVRSSHFPDDWQGNMITCDFRAHRVVRFAVEEQGSGYVTKDLPDVLRSTNVTFRPIDVKLGPDGALYIADWSNPIIQHGEVDFRDPRRDHEHGRIWRITAKGRPLASTFDFSRASTQELLSHLLSPNAFNQQRASRVLAERGAAIQPELNRWTKLQATDLGRLQALWLYQAIDVVEPNLLERVLGSTDGHVRAAATRVLSYWHPRVPRATSLLEHLIADQHPRVRLEALRALARIPTARSAELALTTLDKPMDPFLDYALWLTINDLAEPWVVAVKSGQWKVEGREKQLEFALKALQPSLATAVLAQAVSQRNLARDTNGPWIELIGAAGDVKLIDRLYDLFLSGQWDNSTALRALQALNEAARNREQKPTRRLDDIVRSLNHPDSNVRETAIRLCGSWKLRSSVSHLLELAAKSPASETVSKTAFDSLRQIGGRTVTDGLLVLAGQDSAPGLRRQAIITLAGLDLEKAAQPAVNSLLASANENELLEFWRSLLTVKNAGVKLAQKLPKTDLPPLVAKAGLRAAREGGRTEPELVWALSRGANLDAETQTLSTVELQQLASTVATNGNPERGEAIFRRQELACFTCHAIGGVGGKVGPDLTSIGASAQVDYLIESIFYPNRKIKEGYHSIVVETKAGLEFSGILVRENGDQLILRDATDKETTISKSDIQNRATGNSLMPTGLVDLLSPSERIDLFRFLSELGKPGRYDASKGNVARSWRLLLQTHDIAQFGDEKILQTSFTNSSWKAARSLVDGRLLRDDLARGLDGPAHRAPEALYAAARFEVARAGAISLKIAGADGSPAWIDAQPAGACGDLKPDLPAGTHTVIVKLNSQKLPESLRIESPDVTFLGTW